MTDMYFRKHVDADGTTSIECVNPLLQILVSDEVLNEFAPDWITRDGDRFTFHCMNGSWTYQLLIPAQGGWGGLERRAVLIESSGGGAVFTEAETAA